VPLVFTLCFTLLQQMFEYPDILRQPTASILTKFQAGGAPLVAVWYALTLTALLFVPISLLMRTLLATPENESVLTLATAFGVLAGVFQTLGFLRWPFLVPNLAASYLAPGASAAQQAASAAVFDAFHRYAGVGVGEHLGYLTTALWTVLIAAQLIRIPGFGRLPGIAGIVLGLGVGAGMLEPTGVKIAGTINAISYDPASPPPCNRQCHAVRNCPVSGRSLITMSSTSELHVVYRAGSVGMAVSRILAARGDARAVSVRASDSRDPYITESPVDKRATNVE
jgi:hypothetical protein